jgi:hypothetical protein
MTEDFTPSTESRFLGGEREHPTFVGRGFMSGHPPFHSRVDHFFSRSKLPLCQNVGF